MKCVNRQDVAADRLLTLLPETLDAVYFVNSGAEAIDAAMKLVRALRIAAKSSPSKAVTTGIRLAHFQ